MAVPNIGGIEQNIVAKFHKNNLWESEIEIAMSVMKFCNVFFTQSLTIYQGKITISVLFYSSL
jgi:hypothetical protein